jgi:hypothetical protein
MPQTDVPGEVSSPTPDSTAPPPFARQSFEGRQSYLTAEEQACESC